MIASSAWLLPALPAASTATLLCAGRRLGARGAWLAVLTTLVPFALAIGLVAQTEAHPDRVVTASHAIAPLGALSVHASTRVDALSALLCLVVTSVALLVQVYSVAYMKDDPRYSSYAGFVSLFTAAMLTVVLSSDLLWLLVGWEVMGVCSYLLIGHHWEERPNTEAAISAFLVTRFGDLGFTAGIAALALSSGSLDIQKVLAAPGSHTVLEVAALLLILGVVGKSAQFPLQTWLPDAMAGPTPVSALIHAATMVAAGVYVIDRLSPVVLASSLARVVLGIVAAITMLLGALCALAQDDLKRVLAWSTVSQLAYMYAGLAVGAPDAAISHLVTHAAFKALLFLGAGCVAHLVGSTLLSDMGGLRHSRLVAATMTIGLAALGGFPFLSGNVSKDAILEGAWHGWSHGSGPLRGVAFLVMAAGVLTAAITAAYCTRTWLRVFAGPRKPLHHESLPALMTVPVVLLAIPALLLGGLLLHRGSHVLPHLSLNGNWLAVSIVAAAVGAGFVLAVWRSQPAADPARILGATQAAFRAGLYFDQFYLRALVRPVRDRVASATAAFDRVVVDGAVRATGSGVEESGRVVRLLHTGNVQLYMSVLVVGALVIAIGATAL